MSAESSGSAGSGDQAQPVLKKVKFAPEDTSQLPGSPDEEKLLVSPKSRKSSYCTFSEMGIVERYDVDRLTSWRAFGAFEGTVLQSTELWVETCILLAIYLMIFLVLLYFRWEKFSSFIGREQNIRDFIAMFSTLIGLLLSFFTALNLNRWWQMRMGIHDIQTGTTRLIILISNGVTGDKEVLSAIDRYARTSLYFIFAGCQHIKRPRKEAIERGLLTEDEADQLRKLNPNQMFVQAQTLWVWIANLLTRMHRQARTKGPPHYCMLLKAVELGRAGFDHIFTHLETQIPMGYVHLLCWMVKLHNLILVCLMALVSVKHTGGKDGWNEVALFRVSFRAFFMPFLYNAILVLNTQITEPFGTDALDFEFEVFNRNLQHASCTFIAAAEGVPKWIRDDRQFEPFTV